MKLSELKTERERERERKRRSPLRERGDSKKR